MCEECDSPHDVHRGGGEDECRSPDSVISMLAYLVLELDVQVHDARSGNALYDGSGACVAQVVFLELPASQSCLLCLLEL